MRRVARQFALILTAPLLLAGNRGTPKAHAIVVTTNVPAANIFSDGMVVAKSGEALDAAPGVRPLVVLATGYVSRLIYVKVEPQVPRTTRYVELVPVPKNGEGDIDFKKARQMTPRTSLGALPSLCALYNASATKLPAGLIAPCKRKTLLDDFAFYGLGELRAVPSDGTPVGALRADLVGRVSQAASDAFYWRAEELYYAAPRDEQAITILAYSALLRGACTRSSELGLETARAGLFSPGLALVQGICFELASEQAPAIAALREPLDRKRTTPNALYYLARAAWKTDFAVAETALKTCRLSWPTYYPCAEAAAHLYTLAGKGGAAAGVMRAYLATAAADAAKVPLDASGHAGGAGAAAFSAQYPWIFEAAGLKTAAAGGDPESAGLAVPLGETLLASPVTLKRLTPTFEAAKANAVLAVSYRLQLAATPNDATVLIKLANVDRFLDRCDESLKLGARAMTLITEPARKTALSITMSDCLMRLDRLDDAQAVLESLLEADPSIWKAQYNLGVVLQRRGNIDEAIAHLRMALVAEVPAATQKRIADTIRILQAKQGEATKAP